VVLIAVLSIYLQVMHYLKNGQRLLWPLSELERSLAPEQGPAIDVINRFIGAAAQMRTSVQQARKDEGSAERAERFEIQASVCDEMCQQLLPTLSDVPPETA